MNWYKLATMPVVLDPNVNYLDIGHDKYFTRRRISEPVTCKEYLWLWYGGSALEVEECTKINNHSGTWGENDMYKCFRGRASECNNRISIMIPNRFRGQDVPERLLAELEVEFPGMKA